MMVVHTADATRQDKTVLSRLDPVSMSPRWRFGEDDFWSVGVYR